MSKKQIEIIHKDSEIVVLNKPSGISVTKDRTGAEQLTDLLRTQFDDTFVESLRLIHRLDKDTSGVLVLARTLQAQAEFTSYFEKRIVKKIYLAFVKGFVKDSEGVIETPLSRNPSNTNLMRIDLKKGKDALAQWNLLADFGSIALLKIQPLTGRTHQIRVHLPSIGLPLAIDPLYGNSRYIFLSDFKTGYRLGKGQTEKPLIDRLTLHAYQIELPERKNRTSKLFIAGLDKKFTAALKMLTKYNQIGLDAFIKPDIYSTITNKQRL